MTAVWRELRAVTIVGVMGAVVVAAFPISALEFKARPVDSSRDPSAAFISLSAEEESLALKAAKSAWQSEASATQRMRFRLPLGELPEEEVSEPLTITGESTMIPLEALSYPFPAAVPSRALPAPRRLEAEPEAEIAPAFSREELLNF